MGQTNSVAEKSSSDDDSSSSSEENQSSSVHSSSPPTPKEVVLRSIADTCSSFEGPVDNRTNAIYTKTGAHAIIRTSSTTLANNCVQVVDKKVDRRMQLEASPSRTTLSNEQEFLMLLTKLSREELSSNLENLEMTREDVLKTADLFREDADLYKWYTSDSSMDDDHTQLAYTLLDASPMLRNLRFKLVPARLTEGKFWGAAFRLLSNSIDVELTPENMIVDPTIVMENKKLSQQLRRKNNITERLLKQLEAAESRIKELEIMVQKKLEDSQKADFTSSKTLGSTAQTATTMETTVVAPAVCTPHKGKWIMDKECVEFLAFEEDLKQNLREGKKKRIQDVLDQMRFILDTDDIEGTYGKWDCCGKTEYTAKGCAC